MPPKTCYFRYLRQMQGIVGVYLRPIHPSDGEFLNEGVYVWTSLTTRRHSERKEGAGSGERAPIPVFLPLDFVDEAFPGTTRCILQIRADVR